MAAHSNGQVIIFLSCGFFLLPSSFFFFPRLILAVKDWMSAILPHHTWCGVSANLECMSEMCCTRLAENTGRKNYAKNRHLRTIAQICRAVFATKAYIGNRKKNLINANIFSIYLYNMVNLGSLTAEIRWQVWDTPANFNGFRVLASLLHRRRSTEVNQTLHHVWPSLHWYAVYAFWGLAPYRNFASYKIHFASKSYVLLNWQRYCTALEHCRHPKFAVCHKEWNYGTFAEGATYIRHDGHHVGQRPTF